MVISDIMKKYSDAVMRVSIFLRQLLVKSGIVAWSGMSLFAAIAWRSIVGLRGWLGASGIFLWTTAIWCCRGLGFAMTKTYVAYVLFVVGLIGGGAYWYAGKLINQHHRTSTIVVQNEEAQQVLDEMRERFEQRLTATEQHVKRLEDELVQKKAELEKIVAEREAVIEKKVALASEKITNRVNEFGKEVSIKVNENVRSEKELEKRFVDAEQYIKELEKKIAEQEEGQENKEKEIEKQVNDKVLTFREKVAAHISNLGQKITSRLGDITGKTDQKIQELEQKVHELEKQEVQEAKRLAVINHVIRQEVAEQMGSIKESMQERELKKKRKNLINRFLDQLSEEGDE